ncbi:CapA family protein [Syntrophomonas erecta subsp. sporosyntropha]
MKNNIRISFVGDLMFGDHSHFYGIGFRSKYKKEDPVYDQELIKILKKNDYVIGNLENPISKYIKETYKSGQLISELYALEHLKLLSINIVNVANNHALQHGVNVYKETLDHLKSAEISVIGKYDQDIFKVVEGDISIGILGISLRPEDYYTGENKFYESRISHLEEIIKTNRNSYDYLIVNIHWGHEFMNYPNKDQKEIARKLINMGVKIIIGHHPHVLQGLEKYNDGLIFYSLGNFITDMKREIQRESMILEINFTKHSISYNRIPIYINDDYLPQLTKVYDFDLLDSYIFNNVSETSYIKSVEESIKLNREEVHKIVKRNITKFPKKKLIQNLTHYFKRVLKRKINLNKKTYLVYRPDIIK